MQVVLALDGSQDALGAAKFLKRLKLPPSSLITLVYVMEETDDVVSRLLVTHRPESPTHGESLGAFEQAAWGRITGEGSASDETREMEVANASC